MSQESNIRLGGVEAVYDSKEGLILRDAHQPHVRLRIYASDVPDLLEFVCRHYPEAQPAPAPPGPHWKRSTRAPGQ